MGNDGHELFYTKRERAQPAGIDWVVPLTSCPPISLARCSRCRRRRPFVVLMRGITRAADLSPARVHHAARTGRGAPKRRRQRRSGGRTSRRPREAAATTGTLPLIAKAPPPRRRRTKPRSLSLSLPSLLIALLLPPFAPLRSSSSPGKWGREGGTCFREIMKREPNWTMISIIYFRFMDCYCLLIGFQIQ